MDGQRLYRGKTEADTHLFMSPVQSDMMSQGNKLFIDGTFGTAPVPFYQILVTRTKLDGIPVTTSFSLLPNKRMDTYVSALRHIKETAAKDGFILDFVYVHVDCEKGLQILKKKQIAANK